MAAQDAIRENIGIAIDGGGVRGAVVARGLIELENILGTKPLIKDPRLKVIAGTSTGALISTALAAGLTGEEILEMYRTLGDQIFTKPGRIRPFGRRIPLIGAPHMPLKMLKALEKLGTVGQFLLYVLLPARYSFDPLRSIMKEYLEKYPSPNDNPTLAQLRDHLRQQRGDGSPHPTLIITAVEVLARRTRFLKTSSTSYDHVPLIDAMLASSCIPTYFDPVPLRDQHGKVTDRVLVDGGVGNFGNPALTAAWELCNPRSDSEAAPLDPNTVTIFSFGTGYVGQDAYRQLRMLPEYWWAMDWAGLAIDLFMHDTIREQSRNIIGQYRGIDLRRFQVMLPSFIEPDDTRAIRGILAEVGETMATLIADNRHALHPDPERRHDPEEIWHENVAHILGLS